MYESPIWNHRANLLVARFLLFGVSRKDMPSPYAAPLWLFWTENCVNKWKVEDILRLVTQLGDWFVIDACAAGPQRRTAILEMINLYMLETLTSMRLFTVKSSSQLVMLDLWSAADNEFLKDELLLSWNAANKSHKEVIALIGPTLSTSVKSSSTLPFLPDSKTGFWRRGTLFEGITFWFSFLADQSCHP